MPTPFTHLRIAQELLVDELLPAHYRGLLRRHIPAFQLGGIVADARVASGVGREVTHFYAYGRPISEHPWRLMLRRHPDLNEARDENHLAFLAGYVAHLAADEAWALKMLRQHPTLCRAQDEAHLAFLAGYVAHLAADEAWALKMVRPQFWERDWLGVERSDKFFALHLILTVMDERDLSILARWQAESLGRSEPDAWLPFMTDEVLRGWRDLVARQIAPGGDSETLAIFGRRLNRDPAEIRAVLDDPALMEHHLWRHVPRSLLSLVERQTYAFTREQLAVYLKEFMPAFVSL